ncbi:glycoside hydrolase family 16 protein [Pseudohyphozyma bogoriensis]|nr:glycoside hydrolase family 16 protein [Pseudohyphozyma bogoriensis]
MPPTLTPILPLAHSGYANLDSPRSPHSPLSPNRNRSSPTAALAASHPAPHGLYSQRHGFESVDTFHDQDSIDSSGRGSTVDVRNTAGIQSGQVGADYGPFAYENAGASTASFGGRKPRDSSLPKSRAQEQQQRNPFADPPPSSSSIPRGFASQPTSSSGHSSAPSSPKSGYARNDREGGSPLRNGGGGEGRREALPAGPVWTAKDAENDERLHNVSPNDKLRERVSCTVFSLRGWLNMAAVFILVIVLVTLFAGYPIIQYYSKKSASTYGAYGLGGINASGQVPNIPGLPSLIDGDTPETAYTRTGFDGKKYVLMFSDEFNNDGRTFWPGDDPFWEAVDLHYWQTDDFEWYDPDAITTKDGSLVITITEQPTHNLPWRSGMLQSWNKFWLVLHSRFHSLDPDELMLRQLHGRLCRSGNQTSGRSCYEWPDAAVNPQLSGLPGQRLSACTCSGEDHPGPNVGVGRGAPEVDIIEAQSSWSSKGYFGAASQSFQVAPFDANYDYGNSSADVTIYAASKTELNSYKGGLYQQACSGVTTVPSDAYELTGGEFSTYGFEIFPDTDNGYITWQVDGEASWTITSAAVGPNNKTQIGQRLIPQEPLSIVLNLGISDSFQPVMYNELKFPATMLVDYVRVYQTEDAPNIGCDPADHPTADYIAK